MADNYLEKRMEEFRSVVGSAPAKAKGSLSSLLLKNRSTRGFDNSFKVRKDQLMRIVSVNNKIASARNRQVLRFSLVTEERAHLVLPHIAMGSALSEMKLPLPGTEPNAFVVICSVCEPHASTYVDLGISVQSMLLQAVEIGLNGVCLMSFDKERIKENLSLPYEPLMVLAIGKSAENIRLVDMPKGGDCNYYRENGVHYVPKLSIDDLIIE
ncbi:MAG: nitroreductase family protein [Bacteroidaceae bacterium]|nr:nitroreductase family protein [Bacteroidaceae bacterium]